MRKQLKDWSLQVTRPAFASYTSISDTSVTVNVISPPVTCSYPQGFYTDHFLCNSLIHSSLSNQNHPLTHVFSPATRGNVTSVSICPVGAIYVYCWHIVLFCLDISCGVILDTWGRSLNALGGVYVRALGTGRGRHREEVHTVLTRPGAEQPATLISLFVQLPQ